MTDAPLPFRFETLRTELHGDHVLVVTLNRPEVRNALNTLMWEELLALWTHLDAEPGPVRCIVVTGAGEQAFCAGGDLKERNGMTAEVWRHQHKLIEREYRAMIDLHLPVLAAVVYVLMLQFEIVSLGAQRQIAMSTDRRVTRLDAVLAPLRGFQLISAPPIRNAATQTLLM